MDEKNILGLEVSVHQMQIMQECDTGENLPREILDMFPRKGREIIFLQEIVDALSEQFGYYTYVVPIIEPF